MQFEDGKTTYLFKILSNSKTITRVCEEVRGRLVYGSAITHQNNNKLCRLHAHILNHGNSYVNIA